MLQTGIGGLVAIATLAWLSHFAGSSRLMAPLGASRVLRLTRRGRGVAVVQSVGDYEKAERGQAFIRAVDAGLMDLEAARAFR